MPTYDTARFDPPAPLALVKVSNSSTDVALSDIPMLLDSGADVTLLPQAVAIRLGAATTPDKLYELTGFDGSTSLAPAIRLELTFCRTTFRGQFLLIDQEWGILGRNILNSMPLLLDGPSLAWEKWEPE
jgi:hypothetical protein